MYKLFIAVHFFAAQKFAGLFKFSVALYFIAKLLKYNVLNNELGSGAYSLTLSHFRLILCITFMVSSAHSDDRDGDDDDGDRDDDNDDDRDDDNELMMTGSNDDDDDDDRDDDVFVGSLWG